MRTVTFRAGALATLLLAWGLVFPVRLSAANDMVVHEWGTFTSFQDEKGEAIGGINTDDEPVPAFVHRLAKFLLLSHSEVPPAFFQGAPRCHPDVTMRLETPVIYFHPPSGGKVSSMDVHVAFHGGWLSEFFPDANADALGLSENNFKFGPLTGDLTSKIAWNQLKVGVEGDGPATTAHVWTSPRAVNAATVQTAAGEKEKFLFYRGVAHLDSPLRVSRDDSGNKLEFRSQIEATHAGTLNVTNAWLVEIQRSGVVAFRTLPSMLLAQDQQKLLAKTRADFVAWDFAQENLEKFKATLRDALVRQGLFRDEADALLNTWELSYFKSAGLRVFYLVPQSWTDRVMPLEISGHQPVTRVMVGRIELVTPEQRRLLKGIAGQKAATIEAELKQLFSEIYGHAAPGGTNRVAGDTFDMNKLFQGSQSLSTAKVKVPPTYQRYLDLGRFRNALVLEEQKSRPSESLAQFIKLYHLEASQVPKVVE